MRLYSILICVILFGCSRESDRSVYDYYNFRFSPLRVNEDFRWERKYVKDTITGVYELNSEVVKGKKILRLCECKSSDGRRQPLLITFSQKIALHRNYDVVEIAVTTKGTHLKEGWLKVSSQGIREEILRVDSVNINSKKWREHRLKISLKDVHYIQLSFVIVGENPDLHSGAEMLLDHLMVSVDGQNISKVNRLDEMCLPPLDTTFLINFFSLKDSAYARIPELKRKPRIVGVGESMHGCLDMEIANYEIVKMLVERNDCKLIMLELPSMLILKWDLYIQGYPVSFDEIQETCTGSFVSVESLKDLLDYLRAYNLRAERKVHIAGIDRNVGKEFLMIHDYFYEQYKQNQDTLLRKLIFARNDYDKLFRLLFFSDAIAKIGYFEVKWLEQLLWLYLQENHIPGVREHGIKNWRDYVMSRHAYYAVKAADLRDEETAVVLAHWMHINKMDGVTMNYPSLGYYLAETYGEDYCAIGLLGGTGRHNALFGNGILSRLTFQKPETGTLEWRAMQLNKPYFYYSTGILPMTPVGIRVLPSIYETGIVHESALPIRMDGFIFIRNCRGFEFPKELSGRKEDFSHLHEKWKQRAEEREKYLN